MTNRGSIDEREEYCIMGILLGKHRYEEEVVSARLRTRMSILAEEGKLEKTADGIYKIAVGCIMMFDGRKEDLHE